MKRSPGFNGMFLALLAVGVASLVPAGMLRKASKQKSSAQKE